MPEPILEDQYTAARAYFLCVVGLLFIESAIRWPLYFLELRNHGKTSNDILSIHFSGINSKKCARILCS
jgi:hypothetical protein